MSEPLKMCGSCPFRMDGGDRETLIRWAKQSPGDVWPCHEDDPEGDCDGRECAGHRLHARTQPAPEARAGDCDAAELLALADSWVPDGSDEDETEFDVGYEQALRECADQLRRLTTKATP